MITERRVLILVVALLLGGCSIEGISTEATNNNRIEVVKLFDYKGYEVLRFWDAGYRRYFVVGGNGVVESDYNCGKGCTQHDSIETRVK